MSGNSHGRRKAWRKRWIRMPDGTVQSRLYRRLKTALERICRDETEVDIWLASKWMSITPLDEP